MTTRGTRYGSCRQHAGTDGRPASVICRFLASGVLLIITAYVHEEDADGDVLTTGVKFVMEPWNTGGIASGSGFMGRPSTNDHVPVWVCTPPAANSILTRPSTNASEAIARQQRSGSQETVCFPLAACDHGALD